MEPKKKQKELLFLIHKKLIEKRMRPMHVFRLADPQNREKTLPKTLHTSFGKLFPEIDPDVFTYMLEAFPK